MKHHFLNPVSGIILSALLALACIAAPRSAVAQAAKGKVEAGTPPPPVMFHGLIPGLSTLAQVREALGVPAVEGEWYAYKLTYKSEGRDAGLTDTFHIEGETPESRIGTIEACTIPAGCETEAAIRAKLGEPQFELRMATWKMLDYGAEGVRFSLTPDGKTTGAAFFPHGKPRVHSGARHFIDLSKLRQGPQPAPPAPARPEGFKCGAAEVVISPQEKTWLPQKFEIHDDLKARIVVISDGKLTTAFIGADMFGGVYEDLLVVRKAAEEMGINNTVIGMSHDHSAPDTIGVYGFRPDDLIKYIQTQMIGGLKKAVAEMKPVKEFRAASRELPVNGGRVPGLFRNARNPGVIDPTMSVIQAIGTDGAPIATIVNFACHVEGLSAGTAQISADFPGVMCDTMKADGLGQPVFLNGAVGGMVSGDTDVRTFEQAGVAGRRLAGLAKELAAQAQPPATFKFTAETRRIEVPVTNGRFKMLMNQQHKTLIDGRTSSEMTYIRLGEAEFVSLPGELLPEVSYEILEKMTGFPRVLIGLANDEMGYMIPAYDFQEKTYEESMSMGPATAWIVRDTALLFVQGLK